MVFIGKINNYMFRPKAAIFRLSQLQFCSKSVIYRHIYGTLWANYMFRPKAASSGYHNYNFAQRVPHIDIYMTFFEQTTCFGLKRPSSVYHNYNFAQRVPYTYRHICDSLWANYMFRPKAAIFRLSQLQFCSKIVIYIYMALFEQNCNCDNLKMAALGRDM